MKAIVLAGVLAAAAAPGWAAGPRAATAHRDLSGLWSNASLTELERPDDFKGLVASEADARAFEARHRGKPPEIPEDTVGGAQSEWWETDVGLARIRGQARTSWIVAPADGKRPFTAAAKAAHKALRQRRKTDFDGPEIRTGTERCQPGDAGGPPMLNGGYNDNYQFVQTPHALAIHAEYMDDLRIVRLDPDARHPPGSVRRAMGDSIGHWEGDTLVVETTNFTAREVDPTHIGPPGADMTVVERLTRLGPGEILYAFTVRNPVEYVAPWQGEMVFRAAKGRMFEYACHEGNYAMANMLSGARQAEARPASSASQ